METTDLICENKRRIIRRKEVGEVKGEGEGVGKRKKQHGRWHYGDGLQYKSWKMEDICSVSMWDREFEIGELNM